MVKIYLEDMNLTICFSQKFFLIKFNIEKLTTSNHSLEIQSEVFRCFSLFCCKISHLIITLSYVWKSRPLCVFFFYILEKFEREKELKL